jgi:hypothetical protein
MKYRQFSPVYGRPDLAQLLTSVLEDSGEGRDAGWDTEKLREESCRLQAED